MPANHPDGWVTLLFQYCLQCFEEPQLGHPTPFDRVGYTFYGMWSVLPKHHQVLSGQHQLPFIRLMLLWESTAYTCHWSATCSQESWCTSCLGSTCWGHRCWYWTSACTQELHAGSSHIAMSGFSCHILSSWSLERLVGNKSQEWFSMATMQQLTANHFRLAQSSVSSAGRSRTALFPSQTYMADGATYNIYFHCTSVGGAT